jgi:hypothetical protein
LKTWASRLLGLGAALLWLPSLGPAKSLDLEIWQLSCSRTPADAVQEALSRSAQILETCGIQLGWGPIQTLPEPGQGCELSTSSVERDQEILAFAGPSRRAHPHALSLYLLPTNSQSSISFSIIDLSPLAGCGTPRSLDGLKSTGILLMSDIAFESGAELSGELLSHEIMHELTMKRHPTHAPRGTILTDHIADMGPRILEQDCTCMQDSPFLLP